MYHMHLTSHGSEYEKSSGISTERSQSCVATMKESEQGRNDFGAPLGFDWVNGQHLCHFPRLMTSLRPYLLSYHSLFVSIVCSTVNKSEQAKEMMVDSGARPSFGLC